jgi:nucleoside-diphosphate-sugar epimerase
MRVLVTGANGFIGRSLCHRLLAAGHEVRGLLRPGSDAGALAASPHFEVFHGDVLSRESLLPAVSDTPFVVHLAAATAAGRDATYARINVEGTRNIVDASAAAGVERFVFMSSLAAQGPSLPGTPHVRAGAEQPMDSYGRSKLEAEAIVQRVLGDRATALRPAIAYGPDSPEVAQVIRWVRSRVLPIVPSIELSFVHVEDLVELTLLALQTEGPAFGPYFVSDGEVQTMERVFDRLEGLISERPALRLPLPPKLLSWLEPVSQRISDSAGLGASVSRLIAQVRAPGWACTPDEARTRFGFAPRLTIGAALPEVVAWYRDRGWLDGGHRSAPTTGQTSNT